MNLIITDHAVKRYQERITPYSDTVARFEIEVAFASAKAKHKRLALKKNKNTVVVPTSGFFLIVSHCKVVTVLRELTDNKGLAWPRRLIAPREYDTVYGALPFAQTGE